MIGVFLLFHADKIFPNGYSLCELGAGRGTLCHDILRVVSGKTPPKDIFFLESNHLLKQEQKKNIPDCQHITDLKELPETPIFFLANEFFDALPIDIFKIAGAEKYPLYLKNASRQGCYEWVVGEPIKNDTAYMSGVQEICLDAHDYIKTICQHIKNYGGMGLICDYGYEGNLQKTSFRGFKNHQVTDGLQNAGECDLTANVDFGALEQSVQKAECYSYPVITQKNFLESLHIDTRLHRLLRSVAEAEKRDSMIKGVQKLLNPTEMGEVFKFFCITDKDYGLYPFMG